MKECVSEGEVKEEKEREEKEWRTEDAVAWGRNPEIMERNGARGRGRPQKPRSGRKVWEAGK